ncbi:hypothetical protein OG762_06015 [Streptomyces sp. NBC_01136]|nr:hypothetical protein OG762_06015 [Streptomyces sp. NBC_01136]
MHRTTTTATLLVTVAVTALSGCVTVQRPPSPALPPAPSRPSPPRPDGTAGPQVVQAPAREALELVGPPRKPSPSPPSASAPHRAPAVPQAPPPYHPHSPLHPHPHPQPQPHRPAPRAVVPPPVAPELPRTSDVCALGRKYGGWKPDSPEAVICRRTYAP